MRPLYLNQFRITMAKSQETFGKKEKEKKRNKQRQDKAEKMEERKANAKKGKSLEEMMAYIDENGNISSTPPDPRRMKTFKVEEMQIGVPKQVPGEPEDLIRTGTVTFFNEGKGFGFIKDSQTQESVFVHVNQLTERIGENDKVNFEVQMGPKGPSATNVKKAV
ncbi:cold-shock protein [Flavihumibacter profundi]|jgi:cold shock CspA family protein|uniref:cold-shock protein n=1 Tax=Flavihumibacter profundi TaxID=2716883 RepID=UPI001CC42BB2|nr:cold shock domain-containing protein [Flavihumibacter profundi]MBZ5855915.1 cold shock domain-containing protein [Flavihumibacter profundi]